MEIQKLEVSINEDMKKDNSIDDVERVIMIRMMRIG